jgi:hypothetical protein
MNKPNPNQEDQCANHNPIQTDSYTIKAVGQEEFSDVKVPDAPAEKK